MHFIAGGMNSLSYELVVADRIGIMLITFIKTQGKLISTALPYMCIRTAFQLDWIMLVDCLSFVSCFCTSTSIRCLTNDRATNETTKENEKRKS